MKPIVLDQPWQIELYRLQVFKQRLSLEIKGLKFKVSTAPAIRKELNTTTRPKAKLLLELEAYISDKEAEYGYRH